MQVRLTQTNLKSIPSPGDDPSSLLDEVLEKGQALERRGQRAEARQLYEGALAGGSISDSTSLGQLLRLISRTHLQDGEYTAAEERAKAALSVAEAASDEAGRGRAINMMASIHLAQGQHDEAKRLYLEARESALRVGE